MKTLVLATLMSTSSWTVDKSKHPIYAQIVKNVPTIDRKYALNLSNKIYKVTKKYNLNARIYTAILAQESRYKLNAMNCTKGIHKDYMVPATVCTDFGISQIYFKNLARFDFEVGRLLNDLEYSVEAGAKVLYDLKKRIGHVKDYWVSYNCGLKNLGRTSCQKYKKLVERFM